MDKGRTVVRMVSWTRGYGHAQGEIRQPDILAAIPPSYYAVTREEFPAYYTATVQAEREGPISLEG